MSCYAARHPGPERIDDPSMPAADRAAAMADLERVNRLLQAYAPTFAFLARATADGRPFSLLDVGSGHGDYLRAIARWARARGLEAQLTGIDLSPEATAAARAATPPGLGVTFETADAFAWTPPEQPDLIVSALFLHHLADAEATRFIGWMEGTARRGWHVNDLHRHWVARAGFRALAALAGLHPIVRDDGAMSVLRGFTRTELLALLAAGGVPDDAAIIRWRPLFRWSVDRLR